MLRHQPHPIEPRWIVSRRTSIEEIRDGSGRVGDEEDVGKVVGRITSDRRRFAAVRGSHVFCGAGMLETFPACGAGAESDGFADETSSPSRFQFNSFNLNS